jgi:hypothetical protein
MTYGEIIEEQLPGVNLSSMPRRVQRLALRWFSWMLVGLEPGLGRDADIVIGE